MGVWGFQAFENDDALEWLESGGAEAVHQGLTTASGLEAGPFIGIGTWR